MVCYFRLAVAVSEGIPGCTPPGQARSVERSACSTRRDHHHDRGWQGGDGEHRGRRGLCRAGQWPTFSCQEYPPKEMLLHRRPVGIEALSNNSSRRPTPDGRRITSSPMRQHRQLTIWQLHWNLGPVLVIPWFLDVDEDASRDTDCRNSALYLP